MGGLLGTLASWARDIVESMGYWGVALLIALENVFPPIPSELILPLAGFLVGRGQFNFPLVLLAATVGSVVGALILYGAGRWLGEERIRHFIQRYGKFALIEEGDLDRGADWFDRHGNGTVFFCRLVPGLRSIISVPAGFEAMPLLRFIVWTAAGSALWNAVLIALGWWLGSEWQTVSDYMGYVQYAIYALIVVGVGWLIWRRTHRHRQRDDSGERQPG